MPTTLVDLVDGPANGLTYEIAGPWPRKYIWVQAGADNLKYKVREGTTIADYVTGEEVSTDPEYVYQGQPGGTGPIGPPGPTGPVGPAGTPAFFNEAGVWSSAVQYDEHDLVEHNGSSYVSRQVINLNHTPGASPDWWQVVSLKGDTGAAGATGAAGSRWYSGAGAPAGGLGVVADWYLNDTNGDVYEKTGAAAWTLRDNLTGPAGATGAAGADGAISQIQDEGSNLTVRSTVSFEGAGVTAADSGGKTVVTIPGGGGAGTLLDLEAIIQALAPKSWWKLTQNSGDFTDSGSGPAVTATALGSINRVTGGPGKTIGGAEKTLDTTGIFNAGDVYDFAGTLPFTAMVLFFPTQRSAFNGANRVFVKESAWMLAQSSTNGFFQVFRTTGATVSLIATNKQKLHEWNMLAMAYDGSTVRIFANGYTATAADGGSITNNANPLLLGQEGSGAANWSPKAGTRFACPAIWDRALSLTELERVWSAVARGGYGE